MNKIRLFSSIGIETSAVCNRRCVFCPNHDFTRPDDQMSMEMFNKVLQDLVDLKYKRRVELYIYNEPMRDPRLLEFIALVRDALPRACIMINTNGDYLHGPEGIESLFNAGLNQLQINVYSAYDGTEHAERGVQLARRRHEILQGWLDQFDWIDQESSLYQYAPSSHTRAQVVAKYGVEQGVYTIDGIHHISNRSGNISFKPPLEEPLAKMCTKPFRFLNINWKGDGILCCNDYHGETAFGNVMERSVEDIWNDVELHRIRYRLQNHDRDVSICKTCDFDGGPYQWNVDHVTKDMLQ